MGMDITNGSGSTISGNTITELESLTQESRTGVRGISYSSAGTQSTITANNINNIRASTTAAVNAGVNGISSTGADVKITKNDVTNLETTATGSSTLRGIYISDDGAIQNNVIQLSNGSNTVDALIYGISDVATTGETVTIYHNTIALSGNAASGTPRSAALYRGNGGTHTVYLNLFQNTRTGNGTSYAYYANNTTGLTTDNNYLESSENVGCWGADQATLANWKSASSQAASSVTGTETLASDGKAGSSFAGDDIAYDLSGTVADDKEGTVRPSTPRAGAFEGDGVLPVDFIYFENVCSDEYVELRWATASKLNNDYFTLEVSDEGKNF